jgi:hypothetical protein
MTRVRVAALVLCLFGVLGAVTPALAASSSISGTVTAVEGGAPIGGIRVCVSDANSQAKTVCTATDTAGKYRVSDLPVSTYVLGFAELGNRNFVDEYYDDKGELGTADLVTVGVAESRNGIDAALQTGGAIAGTVTGAGGGAVAGMRVCAFAERPAANAFRCWLTDDEGDYAINGLPAGDYVVEFLPGNDVNYLPQFYEGAEERTAATKVPISGPNDEAPGVDAELLSGVEITGTLTEAESHVPLADVDVALMRPIIPGGVLRAVRTDAAGRYAFRGLASGVYVVGFSPTVTGALSSDCYSEQYYRGSAIFATAAGLAVTAPSVLSGIDGEVTDLCREARPQPVQVSFYPTPPPPPPFRCGKNQRKKWVKGKYRCVKKAKKHRHHGERRHGPGAVATGR